NDIMAITSQRMLFQERKLIFYETRQEAPLNAILSVATETTQLGRIFKYGNVVARTYAGAIYLPMVSFPEQVASFLELQWGRSKATRTRAEAAAMENIIRNRLGMIKSNPSNVQVKPSQPAMKPTLMQGIENWLANLLRLKIETATGTIYRTHWIVLLQRALLPSLLLLAILTLQFIILLKITVFPGGPYAGATLSFILVIVMAMVAFWLWYQYEDWVNDLYIVNADQIIDRIKKPFGKEDRKVAPLKNIQSVEFERGGIWGIILDYGSVSILVGETKMVFRSVFNPSDIQREIFKRMAEREFKEKQNNRENEQKWVIDWIAAYHRVVEQERKTPPGTGFK
ncbi:MAG: hypothetical protein LWX83_08990, partial [Anaerolineae bacterium]|nr:hypothetical protein [Anaerolineae bacterium]